MSEVKSQLFIPTKVKVGFQERSDTYSGKLAYVIYYDNKGVLRKETSWNSWRDQKIDPIEIDNIAFDGFVLNKGVGGARQSYGWNARNEYIRIFDPRNGGFEFEISVANLLFILRECNCMKGKALDGKFVYSWDGKELVLLPENCEEYKNSFQFTNLQSKTVKSKDLIQGASYINKRQESLIYLGKFDYYEIVSHENKNKISSKKHIFYDGTSFVALKDLKSVSSLVSDVVVSNYAELVENYNKSINGSKIVSFRIDEKTTSDKDDYNTVWFTNQGDDYFEKHSASRISSTYNYCYLRGIYKIIDGIGYIESSYSSYSQHTKNKSNLLIAIMESGSEIDITNIN